MSNLKVESDGKPLEFRYRMLLTQGGQRKQDFKGKVQVLARVEQGNVVSTVTFPEPTAGDEVGGVEFRFYQKYEGHFRIPEGSVLRSVDVRVLQSPGGQVKLSKTVNLS